MQTAANCTKRRILLPSAKAVGRTAAGAAVALAAALVVLTAAWLLVLAWLSARAAVVAPGPASTDELSALGASTVAVSIAAWLCVGAALEVLSHAPGRVGHVAATWADRVTPALARRVAAFLLGVGVGVAGGPSQAVAGPRVTPTGASATATVATAVTGTAAQAQPAPTVPADPGFAPATSRGTSVPTVDPGFGGLVAPPVTDVAPTPVEPGFTPGFTPAAPRVRPQADPGLIGARPVGDGEHVAVVHRGDSLWSIAARHLGPDASDAEIARAWPLWFEANRDRIGDDPGLILPGQVLRAPDHVDEHEHAHDETGSPLR